MEGGLEPYRAHSMKTQPSPGSFELDPGSLRIPVYGIARVYLIQVHIEYLEESVETGAVENHRSNYGFAGNSGLSPEL